MGLTDTVGSLVQIGRTLREVAEKIKDAEVRNATADLNLALADLKTQVAGLQEENLQLREQLRERETADAIREQLEVREGVYWFTGEAPRGRAKGPYCTACMDSRKTLVMLDTRTGGPLAAFGKYHCPSCGAHYKGP